MSSPGNLKMNANNELDEIYSELPKIECKRLCVRSCVSDISMSEVEMARIAERVGYRPEVVQGISCPMLVSGMCSIYRVRPLICRLWGIVEGMRCPYGCRAEKIMTDSEGREFVARIGEISKRTKTGGGSLCLS